jgi:NRAMP (natural resistance-associated macrophage protein)-like metal ion transporter
MNFLNRDRWSSWRKRLALFFAVVGPGIITANVDNDAGGIYTYSVAGASHGFALLWTLVPITFALIIVQEMVARMGVVTGKGLADLIREEYGFRTTFLLMLFLLVANLGNTVANFAGFASGMSLFGASRFIVVPIGALFVWLLVVKGSYRFVEKVFLAACVFYLAYPISTFFARPDWSEAVISTLKPSFRFDAGYLFMIIGLVGTTIAPWMQFYQQASVVEKGIKVKNYNLVRWDVILGCIMTDVVAFFIIVACASTIYQSGGGPITSAADAAKSLRPLAGHAAGILFAFGLVNASLFAACILPLSTAYYVCEGLGLESGVDKSFQDAPAFYWLYTGLIVVSAAIVVVLSEARQVPLILISQVANGILLPFILIFMLRLSSRSDLMGEFRNPRWLNIAAWTTAIVMMVITAIFLVASFFPGRFPF